MKRGAIWLTLLAVVACTEHAVRNETTCQAAADCSPGELCYDSKCSGCVGHEECEAESAYGVGATCVDDLCLPCTPGLEGCACASGACDADLVCDATGSMCRQPLGCAEAGCGANQVCQPSSAGVDATCNEQCMPGFQWVPDTRSCTNRAANCALGDPQSILAECAALHRECVESGTWASCEDCQTGYSEVNQECVELTSCDQLDCESEHRDCVFVDSVPTCGPCSRGYFDVNGACRPVVTCAELDCDANGHVCLDPGPYADAYCTSSCGANEVPVVDDGGEVVRCALCSCSGAGELGTHETVASRLGTCVCHTADGYFFQEGGVNKGKPCDADGDGWVRASAKPAIESTDPVIARNAKCRLRRIDTMVLWNDPGSHYAPQRRDETLSASIDLYERDLIDDPLDLELAYSDSTLHPYVSDASNILLAAAHLNSLTKVCSNVLDDFNRDGLSDVSQLPTDTGPDTLVSEFVHYAYFVELYRGWFEPITTTGPGGDRGTTFVDGLYHIREKRRPSRAYAEDAAGGYSVNRVPFVYDEVGAADPEPEFWKSCLRDTHPSSLSVGGPGWDFSDRTPDWESGYVGMTHHSQFRCAVLEGPQGTVPRANLWDGTLGSDAPLQWNACELMPDVGDPSYAGSEPSVVAIPTANPRDPQVTCRAKQGEEISDAQLKPGSVGWVLTRYLNNGGVYQDGQYLTGDPEAPPYRGGCINECTRQYVSIPAFNRCPGAGGAGEGRSPGQACEDDEVDFGKLICGCAPNYGGPSCNVPCPNPAHELAAVALMKAGRDNMGYWACGRFAGTQDVMLEQDPAPSMGYKLRGAIPVEPPAIMPLQSADAGPSQVREAGYDLRVSEANCDDGVPCYGIRSRN